MQDALMSFTTRCVSFDDIPEICRWPANEDELYYCFPKADYPLTERQMAEVIEQRTESTVVCLAERAVAFANFYRWEQGGTCAIGNVLVSPKARQLGAAAFLVEHLCGSAFTKYDSTEVLVSCFNHNTAGLLLYPKLGFEPFAVEERQDRKGQRVALVHLRLRRASVK